MPLYINIFIHIALLLALANGTLLLIDLLKKKRSDNTSLRIDLLRKSPAPKRPYRRALSKNFKNLRVEMKEARLKKDLSQKELASLAGCSPNKISVIERGLSRCTLKEARLLSEILGILPSYLLK